MLEKLKNDRGIQVLLGLLMVVLLAWGSRETSRRREAEALRSENRQLLVRSERAEAAKVDTETRMRAEVNRWKKKVVVVNVDGSRTETEEETSRAIQDTEARMRSEYEGRMVSQQQEVVALQERIRTLETVTVKAAPRWLALVEYEPLAGVAAAGGGMNLGPVLVYAAHPIQAVLAPRVGVGLRF